MSQYYHPHRSPKSCFDPKSKEPFRMSRSKIDLFLNCPRCFYIDRKLGTDRPPGYPFTLNSAVDKLLKKEFDMHRKEITVHPLMKENGIDAVPFSHEKMDKWREALHGGVEYFHEKTNFRVTGAVDDIWVRPNGELIVVDYKATSKDEEVSLDADWQIGYKRQMELYQWLLRKNGFKVSNTGYFVYCNGDTDRKNFNGKLHFDIKIIPYEGKDDWVEPTLLEIRKCLMGKTVPLAGEDCDYCLYRNAVRKVENI